MGENGWVTRYCTPLEVQRTHGCVFKTKNQVRTNHLGLLVDVLLYCCTDVAHILLECLVVGWVGRLGGRWLVGWVGRWRLVEWVLSCLREVELLLSLVQQRYFVLCAVLPACSGEIRARNNASVCCCTAVAR